MLAYPAVFPSDSVTLFLAYLRGSGVVSHSQVINSAWEVLGYGMGQLVPVRPPALAATADCDDCDDDTCSQMSREQLIESLQGYLDAHNGTLATYAAFPWQALIPVILQVINEVLNHLFK